MKSAPALAMFVVLATGSLPARGQDLLWEDFEDGVADGFTVQSGAWEVVDGAYHVHSQGFEVFLVSVAGAAEWTDYHVECDLKALGSVNQSVRFRVQDPLNWYVVNVRGAPYNDALLAKMVNGVKTVIAAQPFPNVNGVWHHFTIDVTRPNVRFMCDATPLLDFTDTDSPFLEGGIALESLSGGVIQWQDMYFDNVLVRVQVVPVERATWGDVKSGYR